MQPPSIYQRFSRYSREDDINSLRTALHRYSQVILLGPNGVGKTALVHSYLNKFSQQYDIINYIHAFEPHLLNELKSQWKIQKHHNSSLVIFDALDGLENDNTRQFWPHILYL